MQEFQSYFKGYLKKLQQLRNFKIKFFLSSLFNVVSSVLFSGGESSVHKV